MTATGAKIASKEVRNFRNMVSPLARYRVVVFSAVGQAVNTESPSRPQEMPPIVTRTQFLHPRPLAKLVYTPPWALSNFWLLFYIWIPVISGGLRRKKRKTGGAALSGCQPIMAIMGEMEAAVGAKPSATDPNRKKLEELARLGWYHSMELPDGRVIPGFQSLEVLRKRLAQFPVPGDLRGKRALDIGAWDGWFSFELERRGAQVMA